MAIILKELIQRAVAISSPASSAIAEQTVEALLPSVFAEVGTRLAGNERTRSQLRRTKVLTFIAAPVQLTSDVLTDYIDSGNLRDPTNLTKIYSHAPWDQFTSSLLDTRLGYFALEGEGIIHVVEPNLVYNPALEPTVTLSLTTPCTPEIPAAVTSTIAVTDEVRDELITALATALKMALTK